MKKKLNIAIIFYYENIKDKDNRLLLLQWEKTQKITKKFSNEELNFYPVIFNQGQIGIFSVSIPKNFLFWDLSLEKKFPYFLLRKCQKFIIVPKEIILSKRDFFYLLNTDHPVLLLKPKAKSSFRQIVLDLKPSYYGVILLNRDYLLKLKKKIAKLSWRKQRKAAKSYQNYELIERIFLTAWFSQIPVKTRQGKSLALVNLQFWQSWRLVYQCAKLYGKKHPLPSLRLKSLHFRLLASEISFVLGIIFSPIDFLWLYLITGFILSYDYFLQKRFKDFFARIFFLPFV